MELIDRLHRLEQCAIGSGAIDQAARIREEITRVAKHRFHLVVVGQFKRGKTTLVNALIGDDMLPVGVIPVTSAVTLISHGKRRQIEVLCSGGNTMEIDATMLPNYISEQGNPNNEKKVACVTITHPSPFLEHGLVLVDTPGVGSLFTHNTETTRSFLPRIDAAVFVLSPDPPITKAEFDFLVELAAEVKDVFVVMNKVDLIAGDDLRDALSYLASSVPPGVAQRSSIHCVSARDALLAKSEHDPARLIRSGITSLERTIHGFMFEKSSLVSQRRTVSRISCIAAELDFATTLELKALDSSVEELSAKAELFRREVETLRKQRLSKQYQIKGESAALETWIGKYLTAYSNDCGKDLQSELSTWAQENLQKSYPDFCAGLREFAATRLAIMLDELRKTIEPEITTRYQAVANEIVDQTNALARDIVRLSARIFDVPMIGLPRIEGLDWREMFSYVLKDDPLFLEFDFWRLFHPFFPTAFVQRRVHSHTLAAILEKLSLNTGRLRASYAYTVQETTRRFLFALDERTDRMIGDIERIVLEAGRITEMTASRVSEHRDLLKKRTHCLKEILDGLT